MYCGQLHEAGGVEAVQLLRVEKMCRHTVFCEMIWKRVSEAAVGPAVMVVENTLSVVASYPVLVAPPQELRQVEAESHQASALTSESGKNFLVSASEALVLIESSPNESDALVLCLLRHAVGLAMFLLLRKAMCWRRRARVPVARAYN